MLNNSFLHIPCVGPTTEGRIWECGIRTIDDFLDDPPEFLSSKKQTLIKEHIHLTKEKIKNRDARYFYDNLSSKEHWRIFKEYRDKTAYIDIETTGLGDPGDIITTIALYDGKNIKYYVNGQNLWDFTKDIDDYEVIVTYNGKSFDIPFIERFFNTKISHTHIDLRYILKSLGYSGGLKSCERQLGIGRTGILGDVDGYFAILLWRDYTRKKNKKSLETLLSYNIEDVLNLEYLMIEAYNRKQRELPLDLEKLGMSKPPENPFAIHAPTVKRIKKQYYYY